MISNDESNRNPLIVVLAAGEGKRMHSDLAKVMHRLAGKPLLAHVLDKVPSLNPQRVVVVVGNRREQVVSWLNEHHPKVAIAVQEPQHGTGHAMQIAMQALTHYLGPVLVLYGDVPLLQARTIRALLNRHQRLVNTVTILSFKPKNPSGYGRIVRDAAGRVTDIVEDRDANEEIKLIEEVNSGIYVFDKEALAGALTSLIPQNAQKELYLTDCIATIVRSGRKAGTYLYTDPREVMGINTPEQLKEAETAYMQLQSEPAEYGL